MGRNVSDKTMAERYNQVFGLFERPEKLAAVINAGLTDARNRMEAFNRRKNAKETMLRSFNLSDEQIKGILAAEDLDGDTGADAGRVAHGAELLETLAKLSKHLPALKHYITSSADGKDLINDLF